MRDKPQDDKESTGRAEDRAPFPAIPFQIGAELLVRPASNAAYKTKTTVYGAVEGQAIIIEEPLFSLLQRAADAPQELICVYLNENDLFTFRSKFKKRLFMNVIAIEYPAECEKLRIRSNTRFRISVMAEATTESGERRSGELTDLSDDGCCFETPDDKGLEKGCEPKLSFKLPGDERIEKLSCVVRNVRRSQSRRFKVGLSISGPDSEVEKILKFTRICSYIKHFDSIDS